MTAKNIKIAWDIQHSQVNICKVSIIVIPANLAPKNVAAIVEEQDTALVLGQPSEITLTDNKPSWFLANKLESQKILEPGSVVIRNGKTLKILAIVHDLDHDPTWKPEWISQALDNILNISGLHGIHTLQMPVLGTQHGRYELTAFLSLLTDKIKTYQGPLEKIWLIIPRENCTQALSYLKELAK